MYNVTQEFLTAIKQNSRQFKSTVTIRATTFDDEDVINVDLDENVNPDESFMIGSVGSSKLEITLMNVPGTLILDGANVTATLSLYTGSAFEDVPLGKFWVDDIDKNKGITKLTCYDNMIKMEKAYFSDLTYPASINAVAQEICTKAGIELASALPDTQINKIEGYSYREAIGFIASFLGGFTRFNRAGKLEIVSYTDSGFSIGADNYFPPLTMNEKAFTIGKLICKVGDTTLTSGSSGNEIQFENPIMTQAQLNSILSTLSNLSYMPYSVDWQGNPALQAGDKITIIDENNNSYSTLLMENKLSYAGGLKGSAAAVGKTDNGQEFSSSGSMKNTVDRIVTEQANIKLLLAEKANIDYLEANYAHIIDGVIDNATIDVAKINNLSTNYAHITNGIIDNATIDIAKVNNLSSTYATITNLEASKARITTLEATTASINNLLAGNIGADNLAAGAIQAGSAVIADGAISSAQIINLDVSKLNTGDISTTKFRIVSDSGNMLMSDNTIQISDASRVRVQIGKDASNDYNMYVWDASGNLMFDAMGLKASGIKDKIIRDDMVSDTANINAAKIDIDSMFSQMNVNGTSTLKGSKVYLDTQAQTLDVQFTSLSNTVSSQGTTIASQGTSISTIQGQISSKIWQTDIDTVADNLQTQIDNHTTEINQNTTDISLKASQSSLDITNNNVSGLTNRMSTAESSIITNANNIALKVEQSNIDTSINAIQVGGRNLVLNSNFYNGSTGWTTEGGTSQIVQDSIYGHYMTFSINGRIYSSVSNVWEVNQTYTVSYMGKADTDGTTISPSRSLTDWGGNQALTTSWQKYTTIINCTATVSGGTLSFSCSQNVPVYITNIKLEKGTKATDWNPAPEDVQSQIDTHTSLITQNANSITLKVSTSDYTGNTIVSLINQSATTVDISASKINLSGYVTMTNLSTSGQTTINGANITTGYLSASRIKSGTLALGGSSNGNGVLNVYDAQSTVKVKMNNLGLYAEAIDFQSAQNSFTSIYYNTTDGQLSVYNQSGDIMIQSVNHRVILNATSGILENASVENTKTTEYSGSTYPQIYGNGTNLVLNYDSGTTRGIVLQAGALRTRADNTWTLGTSTFRWGQIYSSVSTISTSDRNEKNTIIPLDNKRAVDFIMACIPDSFKFNNGTSGRTHYGMVAQDFEEIVFPKLGMTSLDFAGFIKSPKEVEILDANGKWTGEMQIIPDEYTYGLRYEEFIAPLIKTVQVLKNKVDLLEQQLQTLGA